MVLWNTNQSPDCCAGGIAAAEQHRAVRVEDLDPFDVALVEQPLGDRCDGGFVARAQRGRERGAGDLAQSCSARVSRSASSFCATVA